ncbi:FecR domain-containing protein [Psychroflexus tropicus]|uniref:FecR domain-containing protein n=1 Tax=Psychroflexus tropicus TaxID=197345 RepID=UPI00036B9EEB|nr:FecR domain-containing protein [Psychroflexus tropicus]
MKEEKVIKKWLKNELSKEELEAFKELDAYPTYIKLSEQARHFKAPQFDEQSSIKSLKSQIEFKQQGASKRKKMYYYYAGIAAILVLGFFIFNTIESVSGLTSFETKIADTEHIILPDQSEVDLNASSTLNYVSNQWDTKRTLELDGEAYFEVTSGSKFTVNTTYGTVEVLGTKFNVKSRTYGFEVTCYEGSVAVALNDKEFVLKQNDQLLYDSSSIQKKKIEKKSPDWKNKYTTLKSRTLEQVLEEFSYYYDVDFDVKGINTSRLYTGSFPHNNLEIALKSITLPLELTYQMNDKTVILSNK